MTWTYSQSSGILARDGVPVARGHAGGAGCRNDPAAQHRPFAGPLPRGLYTIAPATADGGRLGHNVMELIPDPNNDMYGRDDFFIHGDVAESQGCIILDDAARNALAASPDRQLQVIA